MPIRLYFGRWSVTLMVAAAVFLFAMAETDAQQYGQYGAQYGAKVTDRAPPRCTPDGYCTPRTATWGYYTGRWRRWPISPADTAGAAGQALPPNIRPFDPPSPEKEDQRTPTPTAPTLMDVPSPAPVESSPPADATSMQPMRPAPANPFAVQQSSLQEEEAAAEQPAPSLNQRRDPPPPLPKKLWSLLQTHSKLLSARPLKPPVNAVERPRIARLPKPTRIQDTSIQQASAILPAAIVQPGALAAPPGAVITAEGTDDSDADEVLQAVHFAPIGDQPASESAR